MKKGSVLRPWKVKVTSKTGELLEYYVLASVPRSALVKAWASHRKIKSPDGILPPSWAKAKTIKINETEEE